MPQRSDLGSILVGEKVIGGKDLERVEQKRRELGQPLWQALIEAGLISEDELFFLLAQRYGAPVLADEEIEQALLPDPLKRFLSREQALAAGLLPIDLQPSVRATVVMVDPSDEETLAAFLTRAQVPEGRAVLGRRAAIAQAIERCYGGKPAAQPAPRPSMPSASPPRYHVDEVTGTVKLDPELAAEIARLPARATSLTPEPDSAPTPEPFRAVEKEPPTNKTQLQRKDRPKRTTPVPPPPPAPVSEETVVADERFTRALLQAVEALAHELERRLGGAGADDSGRLGRPGRAGEMARLARRVARQMGLSRRSAEEIGVAAQLYAVDAMLRQVDGSAATEIFGELGWAAASEGGLLPILRALTAASAGFARSSGPSTVPLGARIISVVSDYLQLGGNAGEADLETVSQLLRASSAGAPVVDALLRVLEAEREDRAGDAPAAPATSLLRHGPGADPADDQPTGEVRAPDLLGPLRESESKPTRKPSDPPFQRPQKRRDQKE